MLTSKLPAAWLAFLRIMVGLAWLLAAVTKILDPSYGTAHLQPTLQRWALTGNDAVSGFVSSTLLPNLDVLAFALKALEVLIGISLVLGILTRLGAFGGFAIVAGAWIFQHGYESLSGYAGNNFIVLVTMLFLVFAPASRALAADLLLGRRVAVPKPAPGIPPPSTQPPPTVGSAAV